MNAVRLRYRDEPHRRGQHRSQRRELRLDEARRLLRERHDQAGWSLNQLLPLPADVLSGKTKDGFTYPVAIYDHSEGQAVSGGFAYTVASRHSAASSSLATSHGAACSHLTSPQ